MAGIEKIINFDVLVLVGIAAFVLAKIWQAVKDQLPFWDQMSDKGREIGGYIIIAVTAGLMWYTALNMLPGFAEPVGRILTCIIAGFGPGLVYDIWLDKPAPPVIDPNNMREM